MTTVYAYARQLNGLTGDFVIAAPVGSSKLDFVYVNPAAELVRIVCATNRGSCIANPTIGVDWNGVEREPGGMARGAEGRIKAALAPWVSRGRIANVSVRAEEYPGGQLRFEVTFTDPRDPSAQQKPVINTVQF